jgi:uncharacterized protein YbbK (DUF523 family)
VGDRPRVGISACLLGEPVRYDAGHKRDAWLVDVLGPQVDWVPVCPEVEAGFGTPRETMQLVRPDRGGIALMTTGTARDVTDMMCRYTDRRIEELARARLDGYVLKADSPSCGIDGVPVSAISLTIPSRDVLNAKPARPASLDRLGMSAHGELVEPCAALRSPRAPFDLGRTGRGLFAEALMARLPHLPVADERRLADPALRSAFITRIIAHHRIHHQCRDVL